MAQITPEKKYLEETDLVKVLSLGVLATVEHIGGETETEDTSDEESEFRLDDFVVPESPLEDFDPDNPQHSLIVDRESIVVRPDGIFEDDVSTDESDGSVLGNGNHDAHGEEGENMEEAQNMEDLQIAPDVPVGSALVTRLDNGDDAVVPITDLEVVDRTFSPGQLVLSAKPDDPNLQSGAIQTLQKTLIVRRLSKWDETDESFEISGEELSFFSDVRVDGYIVMGDWLGIVEYIQEDVYVDFPDSSIAVVQGQSDSRASSWLEADDPRVSPRRNPDAEGFFFPGMQVKAAARIWRDASWLRGRYRRQSAGTVRTTKITNVGVQWMAIRQNLDPSSYEPNPLPPPPEVVPYEEVRPLDAFRAQWWRAGDRARLRSAVPTPEEEPWVESSPVVPHARHARPARPPRRHARGRLMTALRRAREAYAQETAEIPNMPDPAAVLQIVGSHTYADVLWQDGTLEKKVSTVHLRPNEHPGAFDFWPGLVVGRSGDDADPPQVTIAPTHPGALASVPAPAVPDKEAEMENAQTESMSGIVVRALLDEKTAFVRWQLPNSREFSPEEEELSFYDLTALSGYDMQMGDTVLLTSREASVQEGAPPDEPRWVGEIVAIGVGKVRVHWLGGDETEVFPDQIIVVSDADHGSEGSEEESGFEGDTDEDGMGAERAMNDPQFRANWEITNAEDGSTAILDELESVLRNSTAYAGGFPLQFLPEKPDSIAALIEQFPKLREENMQRAEAVPLARTMGSLLVESSADALAFERTGISPAEGRHQSWIDAKKAIAKAISTKISTAQDGDVNMESPPATVGDTEDEMKDVFEIEAQDTDANANAETAGRTEPSSSSNPKANPGNELSTPKFDVVEKFETHFYASRSASTTGQAHRPGFASIVVKEYSRLKRNLPAGIFVHGSESQHDLLRATIIGPTETPYENVLFFFDIFLPMTYPAEPPKVHFWSHSRRLNPNLYEDGKVCLSILGTWDGDGVEQWDARTSNVLRVLLSLQAMVFVEQPYYNEAGYEKQIGTIEGKTNSRTYSESALLLCMRHLMQSNRVGGSPHDFEELRREHYAQKRGNIVARLQKLSCMEASVEADGGVKDHEELQYTSRGFKKSLKELTPRVEQSLSGIEPWMAS